MMKHKIRNFLIILCLSGLLGACAETQLVVHSFKRLNNYLVPNRVPENIPEITQSAAASPSAQQLSNLPLSTDHIIELQTLLIARGYDTGGADGIIGPLSRKSIQDYQNTAGIVTTEASSGNPSMKLLMKLRINPVPRG